MSYLFTKLHDLNENKSFNCKYFTSQKTTEKNSEKKKKKKVSPNKTERLNEFQIYEMVFVLFKPKLTGDCYEMHSDHSYSWIV